MKDDRTEQPGSPGRRAAVYWFSDGLPELVFGAAFLAWGILGMVWRFNLPVRWTKIPMIAASLGFLLVFLFDRKILDWLKARLTYPRTGYVRPPAEPKPPQPGETMSLMNAPPYDENVTWFRLATVFVFFQATMLAGSYHGLRSVPVLMTAASVLVYALNLREPRSYAWWSVLPIAVAGWASAWVDVPAASREFLPILIGGAWLLSRGTWALVRYLRANPGHANLEPIAHE